MGRLTYKNRDGKWGLKGIQWKELHEGKTISKDMRWAIYGVLCKLKDYEDTELEPDEVERLVYDSSKVDVGNGNPEKAIAVLQDQIAFQEREGDKYRLTDYYEALKVAVAALKGQLTAKQEDWILVKKRLPERDDFYLTTVKTKIMGSSYWLVERMWFCKEMNAFSPSSSHSHVIAWQPLPEPYKAGKGYTE